MNITAYVLTCDEREPIRSRTLASLEAAGWTAPVCVEVDRSRSARPQDRQCESALALLRRAIDQGPELILFLEDDLEFNRHLPHNLAHWFPLNEWRPGEHFFASLYNPTIAGAERHEDLHFFVAVPEAVYGSQAFLLSLPTAHVLERQWDTVRGMQDIKMSRLASRVTPIHYHLPSLVQHVGRSTWGGVAHTAADFSPDWRAEPLSGDKRSRVARSHILRRARCVEGWLADEEAELLLECAMQVASHASSTPVIVEVGSYCGKSTILFGLTLKALGRQEGRVVAIDAHDGRVTMVDQRVASLGPTLQRFISNIEAAGVADVVVPAVHRAEEIEWTDAIDLLFVDGLHDYASVASDFSHLGRWIRPGGLAAFHDCADHFPDVKRLVGEVVASGAFRPVKQVGSVAVLERR
jgi:predicted O-methyltransferase YrrM